jgi:tetratricopeptide (TPR) repeat protein
MNLFDLSSTIRRFNKEEKYKEALQLFKEHKENFTNEQIASNLYLVTAMLTALRHTGNAEAALRFLDMYGVPITEETDTYLLGGYGWVLYAILKKEVDGAKKQEQEEPAEEFIVGHSTTEQTDISKKGRAFLGMVRQRKEDFLRTVESYVFQQVVKYEESRNQVNWQTVLDICLLFTPEQLSDKCAKIKINQKGVLVGKELASDRENWYAAKSKAHLELRQYAECQATCLEALDQFERLHYNNQSWFARRIALSLKGLGQTEEAIQSLEKLLQRKKDWFIYKELAELQLETGDYEKALVNCRKGMDAPGDLEYKVGLLQLTEKCLLQLGQEELAYKHVQLAKLLRQSAGWNIPQYLQVELDKAPENITSIQEIQPLLRELKHFWRPYSDQQLDTELTGRIETILHDNEQGIDGFIRNGRDTFYFSIRRTDPIASQLSIGKEITFERGEDKKGRAVALRLRVKAKFVVRKKS